MTTVSPDSRDHAEQGFRHEALLYAGKQGFVDGTLPFIRAGVRAGEPTLVMVDSAKIDLLRDRLDGDAGAVQFADMGEVGANPARIIPAWRAFLDRHRDSGRPLRGIGEPIWAARSPAALVECQRHESLLNVACADSEPFRLLCPYDTESLGPDVIREAHRSHPHIVEDGAGGESPGYRGLDAFSAPFSEPLPEPPVRPHELAFDPISLSDLRRLVAVRAAAAGMAEADAEALLVSVTELATNSIRHGGGHGVLRVWREDDALVCEVRDAGRIDEPLAGRVRPAPEQQGGHGLWLVNQLCDLVQIRSLESGSVVRLHVRAR